MASSSGSGPGPSPGPGSGPIKREGLSSRLFGKSSADSVFRILILFIAAVIVIISIFSAVFHNQEKRIALLNQKNPSAKILHVLAYSSLIGPWSAGPALQESFLTENPDVTIEWIDGGDPRLVLQKARRADANENIDVIIGLDQFLIQEAMIGGAGLTQAAAPASDDGLYSWNPDVPIQDRSRQDWQSFDWAPLTLVYREGSVLPPRHFAELAKPEYADKLVWVDPRSSSVGFQFFAWAISLSGDNVIDFLRSISSSRFSFAPSWSAAYGLFKKQQVPMAFSYLTSPVYHWKQEQKLEYRIAPIEDRLPYQVEYAAVFRRCSSCADAQKFVRFLRSKNAQAILMNENYMLPVRGDIIKGTLFERLPHPKLVDPIQFEKINSEQILGVWNRLVL